MKISEIVLLEEQLEEKWSKKYKRSIDCSRPRGFSQRAHCQGRKKVKEASEETLWNSLGEAMSMDDKLTIVEQYHLSHNIRESIEKHDRDYFLSLISLSDSPAEGQTYIVVPLSLQSTGVYALDSVRNLKFIDQKDGIFSFQSSTNIFEYPARIIRDLGIHNTFTFLSKEKYDKFRIIMQLKFDKHLPDSEKIKPDDSLQESGMSLHDWFGKGKHGGAGGGGWDRYNTKGERIGKCGDRKPGEGKPKCLSKAKAASLRASAGKKSIGAAVKKKRREDPNPERKGRADMVSNKTKS